MKILSRRPAAKAARPFGIAPERAETLLAGALLLAGTCRVLGTAFELGRGGLREGAALELAGARDAIAAASTRGEAEASPRAPSRHCQLSHSAA